MQFALLFILAFLVGLVIYRLRANWVPAVVVPMLLFLVTTLLDTAAKDAWMFSLIFGLPIVFVGALLGAYVVQLRSPDHLEEHAVERDSELS